MNRKRRALVIGLSAAPLLLALDCGKPVAAEQQLTAAQLMDDLMWNRGPTGGPFTLVDHTGKIRSDRDFRGKFMLVYFGYTFCPDVCPTDLMAISQAIDALGTEGDQIQPIFISVDPERDTPAQLADYVAAFHPRMIGLTGTPAQISAVARAYKVYYARVDNGADAAYSIDHSGVIYLMGRDGQYLGYMPPQTSPQRLIAVLRRQMAG